MAAPTKPPLTSAQLAGIADALLARLVQSATGMHPTTPEAAAVQAGRDPSDTSNTTEPNGGLISSAVGFATGFADAFGKALLARLATVGRQAGDALADGTGQHKPTQKPATVTGLYATAEQQRFDAMRATSAALAGESPVPRPLGDVPAARSPSANNAEHFDRLISAIKDTARGTNPATNPATAAEKPKDKEGAAALGEVAKTLLKTLIPVSIVATILGSQTSGMQTFISSFKVLGSVIGTALLPAFALGGAVVLSLSDIISDALIPNLEQWYTAVATHGLQAIDWLQKAAIDFANEILKTVPKIQEFAAEVMRAASRLPLFAADAATTGKQVVEQVQNVSNAAANPGGALATGAMKFGMDVMNFGKPAPATPVAPAPAAEDPMVAAMKDTAGKLKEAAGELDKEREKGKDNQLLPFKSVFERLNIPLNDKGEPQIGKFGRDEGIAGRMPDNFRMMVQQLRRDTMPQAQSMSLSQAASNAQLSALNASPFESKMTGLMEKAVGSLEKVADNLKPPTGE